MNTKNRYTPFFCRYCYGFIRIIIKFFKNLPHHKFKKCTICGKTTFLFCNNLNGMRGSMICIFCHSCSRNRHVAKIIMNTYLCKSNSLNKVKDSLIHLSIYEASAHSPLSFVLNNLPKHICSEYFDDIKPGTKNIDGIRCEDLQNLSFADNSFDLVITEDIFEHIRHPELAWSEIKRVLKPGGYHIFTIPFNFDKSNFKRIDVSSNEDIYLVPPRYHGDPLRNEGIIVYNDFGIDLFQYLESIGLPTEVFINNYSDAYTSSIHESYVFRSYNMKD